MDREYVHMEECAICLMPFTEKSHRLFSLKCGHVFGEECIATWGKTHKTCPKCKAPFTLSQGRVLAIPYDAYVEKTNEQDESNLSVLQTKTERAASLQKIITSQRLLLVAKREELHRLQRAKVSLTPSVSDASTQTEDDEERVMQLFSSVPPLPSRKQSSLPPPSASTLLKNRLLKARAAALKRYSVVKEATKRD